MCLVEEEVEQPSNDTCCKLLRTFENGALSFSAVAATIGFLHTVCLTPHRILYFLEWPASTGADALTQFSKYCFVFVCRS